MGEEKSDQIIAFTQLCRIAELDTETALLAADCCRKHKLATADAVVFASAIALTASFRLGGAFLA